MLDVAWCRHRLGQLDEQILDLARISQGFTERLEEARQFWTDSAARQVYLRGLDPMIDAHAKWADRLATQQTLLRDAVERLAASVEPCSLSIPAFGGDREVT